MLRGGYIAAALALAGCQSEKAPNCDLADLGVRQCVDQLGRAPDREMLLTCLPFSPPERITGAWVVGFEANEFYEGQQASPALINKRVGDTGLEIDERYWVGPEPRVFQIELVGRRSRCDMGFPRHLIVVDRVIARREYAGR